jgi:hypothetical protein
MGAVALRQERQAGAVEVDAGVVEKIRVLARDDAAGAEPDLTIFVVDIFDTANDPLAFCNLIFDFAGLGVVKVEMIPAVPLGHPDDFIGFVEIIAEELA